MPDMDESYLGGLDTKNLNEMIRARKHFNWFLGKRARRGDSHEQGLDIIPVITTQRPLAAFIGDSAKPAFSEALNLWQKRMQTNASWYSIPMTLVLAEFGAIAMTQNGKGDWKIRENIGLSQGLKLKRDEEGRALLKKFKVDNSQRDIDFKSVSYEEQGKLLALDLLIQFFHHSGYPWFGTENIIAIDDQFSSAGQLFRELLNQGGRVVTVANADEELKELCRSHRKTKNAFISPLDLNEIQKVNSFNLQNLFPVRRTGKVW